MQGCTLMNLLLTLNIKTFCCGIHYLIKWASWPSEYNSYELASHLTNAPKAVANFECKLKQKRAQTAGTYDGTTCWFSFTKSTTLFTPDRSEEWSPYCAKGRRCFNEGWQLEFR